MDRFEELNEMIRCGWGDVPQNKIPKDWRTSRPRRAPISEQRREEIRQAMLRYHARRRAARIGMGMLYAKRRAA